MQYNVDILSKTLLSIREAEMVLNLSNQSIRRRVREGRLKAVERDSSREKIQIFTQSIIKYLERGGAV